MYFTTSIDSTDLAERFPYRRIGNVCYDGAQRYVLLQWNVLLLLTFVAYSIPTGRFPSRQIGDKVAYYAGHFFW